jgi:uncharacterized membrane protein YqjE
MLGNSITKFLKLDHLIDNLTGYVETKVELMKVQIQEDVHKGISQAVVYALIAFVFALVILFASLGLAIALSEVIGALGAYGLIAAIYLIVGIVLFSKRADLMKRVKKELSKK